MFRKIKVVLKLIINVPYKILFTKISLFSLTRNSNIHKKAAIGPGVKIYNSKLGRYSCLGWNTVITDTVIGDFSSIAADCVIGGASHPMEWVGTSSIFYSGVNVFNTRFSSNEFNDVLTTYIGNDVWIGGNCLIKQGKKIGDGAIVGFGSVVTKDIGAYEIWAGNPAKLIRKRFDEETIKSLLNIQWWTWDEKIIINKVNSFNNVKKFIVEEEKKDENSTCG